MRTSDLRSLDRGAPGEVPTVRARRIVDSEKRSTIASGKAEAEPSLDKPIGLVLVDNAGLLREGLAFMLGIQHSFEVLATLGKSDAALEAVQRAKPDVVVIDAELDHGDPLQLVAAMRQEAPHARVVVKGVPSRYRDVASYLRAGVSGFILNDDSIEELSATIRCVAAGRQVLPPSVLAVLAEQLDRREDTQPMSTPLDGMTLTARELQVVDLLGEGLSNKAIAQRLHIAIHTVKSHVHNVLEKLALKTRLEVAAHVHSHRTLRMQ
jgi:DNA-binding NarL/FixJ family response regulator